MYQQLETCRVSSLCWLLLLPSLFDALSDLRVSWRVGGVGGVGGVGVDKVFVAVVMVKVIIVAKTKNKHYKKEKKNPGSLPLTVVLLPLLPWLFQRIKWT